MRPPTTTTSAGLRDAIRASMIVRAIRGSQSSRWNAALSDKSNASNQVSADEALHRVVRRRELAGDVPARPPEDLGIQRSGQQMQFTRLRRDEYAATGPDRDSRRHLASADATRGQLQPAKP